MHDSALGVFCQPNGKFLALWSLTLSTNRCGVLKFVSFSREQAYPPPQYLCERTFPLNIDYLGPLFTSRPCSLRFFGTTFSQPVFAAILKEYKDERVKSTKKMQPITFKRKRYLNFSVSNLNQPPQVLFLFLTLCRTASERANINDARIF